MENTTKRIPVIKYMLLSMSALFVLLSVVLAPLYVYTSSDYTLSVTLIPEILDALIDLIDILAFSVCYSLIIFASVIYSGKKATILTVIYAVACLIRRTLDLVMTFITHNYIEWLDIESVCFSLIVEYIQVLIVLLLATRIAKSYHMRRIELKKAAHRVGSQINADSIEFNKIYSGANPMQLVSLISGIMLSVTKLLARIRFDVFYAKLYGAPSTASEIMTMIVYYSFDICVCILFYGACWLILSKLYEKHKTLTEK